MNQNQNNRLAFDLVKVKCISKEYWRVRAIMAELGRSDTDLKLALRDGHGVNLETLTPDTMLHFVVSSQVIEGFRASGHEPTMLQVLGSAETISDESADAALEKWRKMKQA